VLFVEPGGPAIDRPLGPVRLGEALHPTHASGTVRA
jgi:hypothetical protein